MISKEEMKQQECDFCVELLNEPCAGAWGYYPVGGCDVEDSVWFNSEEKRNLDIGAKCFVVV